MAMETEFFYRPAMEYERIFCILANLSKKIYQNAGFLLLPYRTPGNPMSVYLPMIKSFNPQRFSSVLEQVKEDIPLEKSPAVSKVLSALRQSGFKPEKIDISNKRRTEKHWRLIEPQFEDYLLEIFPYYRYYHIRLEIFWTRYGSLVAFGFGQTTGKNINAKIYLRDDMGVSQIAEGLLSSLLWHKTRDLYQYSWLQREAIIDFLMRDTKFSRLFPDYHPTLSPKVRKRKFPHDYKESAKYLERLGFFLKTGLSVRQNMLLINNRLPKFNFSPTESKILKKLIAAPNEPVSYYELGDLVWKDDVEKFSLWALSRMIFKIRNKLRKNGLSPEHIKNLRGLGYYYTNQP